MKAKRFRANVDTEALDDIIKFLANGYKRGEYSDPKFIVFDSDLKTEEAILTLIYEDY